MAARWLWSLSLTLETVAGFLSWWRSVCELTWFGGPTPRLCQRRWCHTAGRKEGAPDPGVQHWGRTGQDWVNNCCFSGVWTWILENKLCLQCFWADQARWVTCCCSPDSQDGAAHQAPAKAVGTSGGTWWRNALQEPTNVTSTFITKLCPPSSRGEAGIWSITLLNNNIVQIDLKLYLAIISLQNSNN